MKATTHAPVVVASSSTQNTIINPPHSSMADRSTIVQQPFWVGNPPMASTRPISSASHIHNQQQQHQRPVNSAPHSTNLRSQQLVNVAPDTNRGNVAQNSGSEGNKSRVFSPRRRKNNGEQPPQGVGRNAQPTQNPPETCLNRVLVTGYPSYTQPHDLLEVFTKFGNVRIDKCNAWSATLSFTTEEQAKKAILANKRMHIYGHFLAIRQYSAKLKAEEGPQSPKREFTMTKQKTVIIEPSKIDLSGDFHTQLDTIMATIRLNQDDINKISLLYKDLENAFQIQWPGCKAIPFGSITTGLGIKTSDADCFMSLPPQFRSAQANHVSRARRLLLQYPHTFAEILAIPRANTPIVKLFHVPTGTHCDLTFKTPLGAQNSRLIAFLLRADPRVTPVAVAVKYWAKVHELSGTGKLTNYALTLLVVFYLQQGPRPLLPSVAWLQRDRARDVLVDHWNTGFVNDADLLPPTSNDASISELLGGFFEYYSMFNFEEMVVCPYLGVPVKKQAFVNIESLPDEFTLYKKNVTNNFVMPIRCQTSICVQDPFEQCHNVASSITSRLALDIKTYFKFAANAYEKEKLQGCKNFLKTILVEKPKLIRTKMHPEYRVNLFPRIINTIINVDWKSVVRELVMVIFEKMMKIKLGKVEEKVNPDTKKEKEKYMGNLTNPIWKRKKYNSMFTGPELGIEEKQSLITEELIKKEVQPVSLQFQLTMTFCYDPKSAVIGIRMGGGDLDAFREFGKFFISVMQSWITQLLKPYAMPNCKDTAAKIAETVQVANNVKDESDDDKEGVVLTPSTKPAQDEAAVKEPAPAPEPAATDKVNNDAPTDVAKEEDNA